MDRILPEFKIIIKIMQSFSSLSCFFKSSLFKNSKYLVQLTNKSNASTLSIRRSLRRRLLKDNYGSNSNKGIIAKVGAGVLCVAGVCILAKR